MILALGARGSEFDSRLSPKVFFCDKEMLTRYFASCFFLARRWRRDRWKRVAATDDDDERVCAICQKPCTRLACDCLFMHRECAMQYKRRCSATCTICHATIECEHLSPRPRSTLEEREVVRKQRFLRRERELAMHAKVRAWRHSLWPIVVDTLPRRPRDLENALLHLRLPNYEGTFIQRVMDRGGTRIDADRLVDEVRQLDSEFETLSISVRRRLQSDLASVARDARNSDIID